MLTAARSQCLLAKTFMMIYAASSFIISIKTHCCVCKVVGCCRTTNHVKGVVGGKRGGRRESWACRRLWVACERFPPCRRHCDRIAIEWRCEGVSVVAEVARQKVASRKVVGDEASFLSTPTGGGRLGNVVQHVPVPECPGCYVRPSHATQSVESVSRSCTVPRLKTLSSLPSKKTPCIRPPA